MSTTITGDSPQAVALELTERIAVLEGKSTYVPTKGADRQYVLTLYKECLDAVLNIPKWGPYGS